MQQGIVKRLIKAAKECKHNHTQAKSSKSKREEPSQPQDHVLGKHFAQVVKKAQEDGETSDLDLDFLPEEAHVPEITGNVIANANIVVATNITSGLSPTHPTPLPISSLSILHRTDHAPGPLPTSDNVAQFLPIHQSVLSHAFVKVIGRFGRWTRVFNSRSMMRSPISACADVSAFDLDLNISKDLLTINGGVETYLRAAEARRYASKVTPRPPALFKTPQSEKQTIFRASQTSTGESGDAATDLLSNFIPSSLNHSPPDYTEAVRAGFDDSINPRADQRNSRSSPQSDNVQEDAKSPERPISIQTTSTMSFGIPLSELGQTPMFPPTSDSRWQFDIASLDDLDLSDSSSPCPSAPLGLKKPFRKLPLRRDFEFAPRPETVSSLGIVSQASVISGPSSSSASSVRGLGTIQQWQMNALIDSLSDDEEDGDVEAALRRLEGHINTERQQEKTSKVNGWVRHIRDRLVNGDYEDEQPRFPADSDEEGDDTMTSIGDKSPDQGTVTPPTSTSEFSESGLNENLDVIDLATISLSTNLPSKVPPPPGLDPPSLPAVGSRPLPEEAVPAEILESRLPLPSQGSDPETPLSRFGDAISLHVHQSFILGVRAEDLARHFSMIDRELFIGVKFEELVLDDWAGTKEINVLDWAEYLKDCARFKAEHRFREKTSALAALRARFNLIANFVISEIVLTHPNQRPTVVGKFVRVAWVSERALVTKCKY